MLLFYTTTKGVCAKVEPVDVEHGDNYNFWAYSIKVCNSNRHVVKLFQKEYLQCDQSGRILQSQKIACGAKIGENECYEFMEAPRCYHDAALSIFKIYWKNEDEEIFNLDIVIPRFGMEDEGDSIILH